MRHRCALPVCTSGAATVCRSCGAVWVGEQGGWRVETRHERHDRLTDGRRFVSVGGRPWLVSTCRCDSGCTLTVECAVCCGTESVRVTRFAAARFRLDAVAVFLSAHDHPGVPPAEWCAPLLNPMVWDTGLPVVTAGAIHRRLTSCEQPC